MLPSAAFSIGSSTLQRSKKPGKKKRGISTQVQMGMVQQSLRRYHLLITSSKRERGIFSGLITSFQLTRPRSSSILKMLPYFLESKGWRFYNPQNEILQLGLQTIRHRNGTLYRVFFPDEKMFRRVSRRTGQTAIQTGPIQQIGALLYTRDSTTCTTPARQQSPSTTQYIQVLLLIRSQEHLIQSFTPLIKFMIISASISSSFNCLCAVRLQ